MNQALSPIELDDLISRAHEEDDLLLLVWSETPEDQGLNYERVLRRLNGPEVVAEELHDEIHFHSGTRIIFRHGNCVSKLVGATLHGYALCGSPRQTLLDAIKFGLARGMRLRPELFTQ